VTYSFQKERDYTLDTDVPSGIATQAKHSKITLNNGAVIDLNGGNEQSEVRTRKYLIKIVRQ
jgi:hypothetical protein